MPCFLFRRLCYAEKTYCHLYPSDNEHIDCMPKSFRKCSSITFGGEVFGSYKSRHKRSSYIMAYWHYNDGKIISDVGSGDLQPGLIQYFVQHNLLIGNESRVHLFAKVFWLMPLPNVYRFHCGKPVEIWKKIFMTPLDRLLLFLYRESFVDIFVQKENCTTRTFHIFVLLWRVWMCSYYVLLLKLIISIIFSMIWDFKCL